MLTLMRNKPFVEDIFAEFLKPFATHSVSGNPAYVTKNTDAAQIIAIPMIGVSREKIDLEIQERHIRCSWSSKILDQAREETVLIPFNTLSDAPNATAKLADGILTITIPHRVPKANQRLIVE